MVIKNHFRAQWLRKQNNIDSVVVHSNVKHGYVGRGVLRIFQEEFPKQCYVHTSILPYPALLQQLCTAVTFF